MPNVLPVEKTNEPAQPVLSIPKEMPPEDLECFEKEPPTPTNSEPPAEAIAVKIESAEVVPVTPSDSGSAQTNGNIASEVTSSDTESEESKEESNRDATSDFDTNSEADSSEPPYEALNQYVALPSVVVEEDEEPAVVILQDVQELQSPESTEEAPPPPHHPKLAMQEDFDLSPSSEKIDLPEKLTTWARSLSKESVDSSKFAMTETEFSDWADNSLGGDLDAELNIDPEPVKQTAAKEQARPSETPAAKPAVSVNNGSTNLDDIEYADDSEERVVDFKGYTNLVEETPTPEKPDTPVVIILFYSL